jgi:hypothetical protein
MNPKEQWIDETLDALDGTERASLPQEIKVRILQYPSPYSINRPTKPLFIWSIAAAIILLIALNFATGWILKSGTEHETTDNMALSSLEYLTPINY